MTQTTATPQACPKCGQPTTEFISVDAGMRLALTSVEKADLPNQVCAECYSAFSGKVSKGVKLRAELKLKEQNRNMMWKNRVNLVKQARQLMNSKAYPEAAVCYEKYLRVLELVFDLPKGGLTPDVFNRSSKSKELTVITSIYWDLLRIYDINARYADRMNRAAEKLAQFAPFSPILPDIIKKADAFVRAAKNPHVVKQFLKQVKAGRRGCVVATLVFQDSCAPEVLVLRRFRDETLMKSGWGRPLVRLYYRVSPWLILRLHKRPRAQACVRFLLTRIASLLH